MKNPLKPLLIHTQQRSKITAIPNHIFQVPIAYLLNLYNAHGQENLMVFWEFN